MVDGLVPELVPQPVLAQLAVLHQSPAGKHSRTLFHIIPAISGKQSCDTDTLSH